MSHATVEEPASVLVGDRVELLAATTATTTATATATARATADR
jgi:hypothetical protein